MLLAVKAEILGSSIKVGNTILSFKILNGTISKQFQKKTEHGGLFIGPTRRLAV